MKSIDLNVDVGEGAGFDAELLGLASSANVCCGAHAGSEEQTLEIARMARAKGVRVGAHPGYPDRESMGRRPWGDLGSKLCDGLLSNLISQVLVLGTRATYIKPHGGLYNDSCRKSEAAIILSGLVARFSLPLVGLPGSYHESIASTVGVAFIREGFADRRYGVDGLLVPRGQPNALLADRQEISEQVLRLAESVDSICVHGDGPDAVEILTIARNSLESAGYEVRN